MQHDRPSTETENPALDRLAEYMTRLGWRVEGRDVDLAAFVSSRSGRRISLRCLREGVIEQITGEPIDLSNIRAQVLSRPHLAQPGHEAEQQPWYREIPGFRTGTPWKRAVAAAGYASAVLLFLIGVFAPAVSVSFLALEIVGLAALAVNCWGLRRRVPLVGSSSQIRAATGWAVLVVIAIIADAAIGLHGATLQGGSTGSRQRSGQAQSQPEVATAAATPTAPPVPPTPRPTSIAAAAPTVDPHELTVENVTKSLRDNLSFMDRASLDHLEVEFSRGSDGDLTRVVLRIQPKLNSDTDALTVNSATALVAAKALYGWYPGLPSVRVDVLKSTNGATWIEISSVTATKLDYPSSKKSVLADSKLLFCTADASFVDPSIWAQLDDKGCLAPRGKVQARVIDPRLIVGDPNSFKGQNIIVQGKALNVEQKSDYTWVNVQAQVPIRDTTESIVVEIRPKMPSLLKDECYRFYGIASGTQEVQRLLTGATNQVPLVRGYTAEPSPRDRFNIGCAAPAAP